MYNSIKLVILSISILLVGCQGVVMPVVDDIGLDLPRTGHTATRVGHLVYLIGGVNGEGEAVPMQKLNLDSGKQTTLAVNLLPRVDHTAVYDGKSKIYLIGGEVCTKTRCTMERRVEVVDIHTLEISYAEAKPDPSLDASAAYHNGEIFVFGGSVRYRGRKVAHSLGYALDLESNSWRRLAMAPSEKESAIVSDGGKFYLLGGYDHRNKMKQVEVYDPQFDQWSTLTNLPFAISGHEVLATDSGIYVFGDYDHPGSIYRYQLASHDWQKCDFYVKPSHNVKVVGVEDRAYLIGGHMGRDLNALDNLQQVDLSWCH